MKQKNIRQKNALMNFCYFNYEHFERIVNIFMYMHYINTEYINLL